MPTVTVAPRHRHPRHSVWAPSRQLTSVNAMPTGVPSGKLSSSCRGNHLCRRGRPRVSTRHQDLSKPYADGVPLGIEVTIWSHSRLYADGVPLGIGTSQIFFLIVCRPFHSTEIHKNITKITEFIEIGICTRSSSNHQVNQLDQVQIHTIEYIPSSTSSRSKVQVHAINYID
jgi:hypothetical protein